MPALPVFPTLPGREWPIGYRTRWSSTSSKTKSGRVFSEDHWSYPIIEYNLRFEFLREGASFQEASALLGFFDQAHGSHSHWYYTDEFWSSAAGQQFGIGDGSQLQFPLAALRWGQLQPIGGVDGSITVTIDGAPTGAYSLIDERIVSFNSAPANGLALAWSGDYFHRCRFSENYFDAEHFAEDLLSARGVRFETVKP